MKQYAQGYDAVNLVADPVHGYIKITKRGHSGAAAAEQDLLDDPWLQRLRRIHQLQSAWWVFPGGEHSRFQHALGAMHVAGEWARQLYPNLQKVARDTPSLPCVEETLRVAGLVHDVGHGPFGHFFDQNYLDEFSINHEDIGQTLVLGDLSQTIERLRSSPSGPLEKGEIVDSHAVAELMAAAPLPGWTPPRWVRLMKAVLNGVYTADNMDYVPRDAYMCGVTLGPVDIARLMHYSFLGDQGLVLHQHGAQALLMFLNARLYLYNTIYHHRTVRRIDMHMREIFRETIRQILPGDPQIDLEPYLRLTDWSLIETVDRWQKEPGTLGELGREWARIVRRELKWRLIFEDYYEVSNLSEDLPFSSPGLYESRIRAALPPDLKDASFEVDLASVDPRPQNPLSDPFPVKVYNPTSDSVEQSAVADLFRRLPIRTTFVRVFTDETERAEALRRCVEAALYRRDAPMAQAVP